MAPKRAGSSLTSAKAKKDLFQEMYPGGSVEVVVVRNIVAKLQKSCLEPIPGSWGQSAPGPPCSLIGW